MSETLSDKTAFITGGARGIGRATALKLLTDHTVVVDGGYCISG